MKSLLTIIAGILTLNSAYAQSGGVIEGLISERINVKWSTGFQSIPSGLKITDVEKIKGLTSAFGILHAVELNDHAQEIFSDIEADTGCEVLLEIEAVKSPIDVRQMNDLGFNTKWIIRGKSQGYPFQTFQNIEMHGFRDAVQLMSISQTEYIEVLQKFSNQFLRSPLRCDGYHKDTSQKLSKSLNRYETSSNELSPNFNPTLVARPMHQVNFGKDLTRIIPMIATIPLTEEEKARGQVIPKPMITNKIITDIFRTDRRVDFDLIHNSNTLTNDLHEGREHSAVFKKLAKTKLFALAFADLYLVDRDQLDSAATAILAPNETFSVKFYFQRYDIGLNSFGAGLSTTEESCLLAFLEHRDKTERGQRWEEMNAALVCAPGITVNLVLIRDGHEVAREVVKPFGRYLYGPGTGNTIVNGPQIIEAMGRLKHEVQ